MHARRSFVFAAVPAAIVVLALGCSSPGDAPNAAQAVRQPAPATRADPTVIAVDLPPLPPGINSAARAPEVVRVVYEFAARHPEVLNYVPCICSCERMGHKGNHDCFVSKRDAAGNVTAWESHGMICEVCLDIGADSMRLHNSGASVAEIRKAIDKKYVMPGGTHTPTPAPPKGGE